jgi:hypothetical protein
MVRQAGFFDVEERLRELSAKGDDLERIAALVDFVSMLRLISSEVLAEKSPDWLASTSRR